ncbi:MAG: ribonuclease D [Gemmataceae bacterium]
MPEITEEIVSTPEGLQECCAYLSTCSVIGFDTEFVGEETYHPKLCLVQVATHGRLFLIDPFEAGPLDAFWQLLLDPARAVVVHAGREEVRLCRLWSGHAPANLFDLQLAAGLAGLPYPLGHGALVGQILGVRLAKGETLTEWRRRPLTPEQVRYAFDDVRFLLRAHERLTYRLAKLGRLDWATEEFARLATTAGPRTPPLRSCQRKPKWDLACAGPQRLAVVRVLYRCKREDKAAWTERLACTIIRDTCSSRSPGQLGLEKATAGGAWPVYRAPRGDRRRRAEAWQTPPEQCPAPAERDQDPPPAAADRGILIAVRLEIMPARSWPRALRLLRNNDRARSSSAARRRAAARPARRRAAAGGRRTSSRTWTCWRAGGWSASPTSRRSAAGLRHALTGPGWARPPLRGFSLGVASTNTLPANDPRRGGRPVMRHSTAKDLPVVPLRGGR